MDAGRQGRGVLVGPQRHVGRLQAGLERKLRRTTSRGTRAKVVLAFQSGWFLASLYGPPETGAPRRLPYGEDHAGLNVRRLAGIGAERKRYHRCPMRASPCDIVRVQRTGPKPDGILCL